MVYSIYMANARKAVKAPITKTESFTPRNQKELLLCKAFLTLKTPEEVGNFLRDLLTVAEIEEFANRLEIVRLLSQGQSYQEIAEKTKTSTTTVTRVAQWFFSGCGGYATVMKRLKKANPSAASIRQAQDRQDKSERK